MSVVPLLEVRPSAAPVSTVVVDAFELIILRPATRFGGFATSLLAPAVESRVTEVGGGGVVPVWGCSVVEGVRSNCCTAGVFV